MRKKRETHTHTHAMNKKKRMREITTTKMCSNQQPKNRNNVFNELAPTMKYRTKKNDLLETTLFFQNEENISVLC